MKELSQFINEKLHVSDYKKPDTIEDYLLQLKDSPKKFESVKNVFTDIDNIGYQVFSKTRHGIYKYFNDQKVYCINSEVLDKYPKIKSICYHRSNLKKLTKDQEERTITGTGYRNAYEIYEYSNNNIFGRIFSSDENANYYVGFIFPINFIL